MVFILRLRVLNICVHSAGSNKCRKLHLYSSHDSMVMPLLVALGCYEWEWPPFASYIAYELFKHKKTGGLYIKVIYNGKVCDVRLIIMWYIFCIGISPKK